MENNTTKIRCSVRSNLFRRLSKISECTYFEKYHFNKFFELITTEKVDEYRRHKNLSYYEACCEYWLYIMFGWTEYDEEKYAELLEMPIIDLYDKLSDIRKNELEKDFE